MSANDACNDIVDAAIGFAEQRLVQHGEFFPYGARMLDDGKIEFVVVEREDDRPASDAEIAELRETLSAQARAGEIAACGIFYDVKTRLPDTGEPADAIAVALDHHDDHSIIALLPYQVVGDQIAYAPTFAQAGEGAIFP